VQVLPLPEQRREQGLQVLEQRREPELQV